MQHFKIEFFQIATWMKHEIATSMIPWPGKSIICNLRAADQSLTSASAHYWEKLCQLAKIIQKMVIANSWCRVWNRYSKDKLHFRCVDYVFRRILISIGSDHCQPLSGDSLTNSWLAEVQLTFWGWILAKTLRLKFGQESEAEFWSTSDMTKHCQRNNGTKALSTLTHSTILFQGRSFNKFWNLSQTSVWFCWAKGEETLNNFEKSI